MGFGQRDELKVHKYTNLNMKQSRCATDKSRINHDDSTGITTSKTPVPVKFSLPATMFPDGVVRSSKSPCSVASEMKEAVVSYDAFRRGDGFVEMPERLKGL